MTLALFVIEASVPTMRCTISLLLPGICWQGGPRADPAEPGNLPGRVRDMPASWPTGLGLPDLSRDEGRRLVWHALQPSSPAAHHAPLSSDQMVKNVAAMISTGLPSSNEEFESLTEAAANQVMRFIVYPGAIKSHV
eukprot:scaffold58769_cov32-Prasinocladus_malaysianus.AAC.1